MPTINRSSNPHRDLVTQIGKCLGVCLLLLFAPLAGVAASGASFWSITDSGGTADLFNFTGSAAAVHVKVCKITADEVNIPIGTPFTFTVRGFHPASPTDTGSRVQTTETIQVMAGPVAQNGFCTYAPGTWVEGTQVVITETGVGALPSGLTFADVRVSRIRGLPGLDSSSIVNKTATAMLNGLIAEVEFTDFVFHPALLKICKTGEPYITGNFSFTMSLANGLTSYPVSTAPIIVPIGSCTFAQGPFAPIPNAPGIGTFNLGTQVTLTEAAAGTTYLLSVTSPTGSPIIQNLQGRYGTITLDQNANGPGLPINEISFRNGAEWWPPDINRFDFDGDARSDLVVYRNGTWWYAASGSGMTHTQVQFGIAGDKLVAADYDGDGRTDPAVFRNGLWYVLRSSAGLMQVNFGLPGDIPQPGDYDGDGLTDFVVFRPSDGNWYMQLTTDGFRAVHFGIATDRPVPGDFDGDGKFDPAVYRDGTWYILASTTGYRALFFGRAGDVPVQADYDGDRKTDIALYRGGIWYVLGSSTGFNAVNYGLPTDTPVQADYDGDGKADIAVCRTSTMTWYVSNANLTQSGAAYQFGIPGDVLMNY